MHPTENAGNVSSFLPGIDDNYNKILRSMQDSQQNIFMCINTAALK